MKVAPGGHFGKQELNFQSFAILIFFKQIFACVVITLNYMPDQTPLVEVNRLYKQYPGLLAVDELSFSVNQGDVYGFLGQNGAGKSTTIRMLLSLIRPSSGSIKIFGLPLETERSKILRKVGAVIEKPDLYKYLSAYDNLKLFARMSGIRVTRQLLMDQLQMVGLDQRAHDKAGTFSQGMKQRLGIAVALVHNPDLVILDEPTNGLDPQGIADMRQLILRMCHEMGKTVIISSHLLSEIELVANRMLIIHRGKKMVEGVVSELLDPSHTWVELSSKNIPLLEEVVRKSIWGSQIQTNGQSVSILMNKSEVPEMIRTFVEAQVPLNGVNTSHSLENYFLSLTNPAAHVEPFAN